MNKFKYIVLLSALGLTACGGESADEVVKEETAIVEQPVVEEPAIEEPTVEEPTAEEPTVEDVHLLVPKNLRITSSIDTVTVDWGTVPNATSYNVYYNEGDDVSAANGMVYYTTMSEFTHSNVSGELHSYKVQAVFGDSESDLSTLMTAELMSDESMISDSSFDPSGKDY